MLKIGVKYCGNCNPQINGPKLVKKVKKLLPDSLFLSAEVPDIDVLLIVSGCPVDCATRPKFIGPLVVIAGKTVDRMPCEAAKIAEVVAEKLQKHDSKA